MKREASEKGLHFQESECKTLKRGEFSLIHCSQLDFITGRQNLFRDQIRELDPKISDFGRA